jgi:hypothetical protein
MVLLSAQSQAPGFQVALSELYRIYWYPLYAYVRRRGHAPEETQDLTRASFCTCSSTRHWAARTR